MSGSPVKKKNPVGRPRKDGRPLGQCKNSKIAKAHAPALKIAASEAAVQIQKRPRGRPRKDGTMPGSKRVGEASASALISQPVPEPSPLSLPSPPTPRNAPSQVNACQSHEPTAGPFTYSATEGLYNTHISSSSSELGTEFDDDTDEEDTDADDTDVDKTRFRGTEMVLRRFEKDLQKERLIAKYSGMWACNHERVESQGDWDCEMFPELEHEDGLQAGEGDRVQTEEEKREASRQRQKRVCEAHDCDNQTCRINHVRRRNVACFLEHLDERTSQLNEPLEAEVETAEPMDDSTGVKDGKQLAYLMETEVGLENQFEPLFSGIMRGHGKNQSSEEIFAVNSYRRGRSNTVT